MKKLIIISLAIVFAILLASFTDPKTWMKYPKAFIPTNFDVSTKPTKNTEWDYYYLRQMKDTTKHFWADRIADVDSNYTQYEKEYANVMEFINGYRKSKGMTELKYSRKLSLEAELSQYYFKMHGINGYNSGSAITHYLNSNMFYGFQDRTSMMEKNIDFEKNIKVETEIVTGCSKPESYSNLSNPGAQEYYRKYNWAAKFIISPGHHYCMLRPDLNNVGIYVQKFDHIYLVMIVFGSDKNTTNEYKQEFKKYERDAPYYAETKAKFDRLLKAMMLEKETYKEDYRFF